MMMAVMMMMTMTMMVMMMAMLAAVMIFAHRRAKRFLRETELEVKQCWDNDPGGTG